MIKKPDIRDKDIDIVVQHYGQIKGGWYHYITPSMLLAVSFMITIVALGFTKIATYFMHGPVLNGLMLIVISSGIAMAFHNNFAIYRVARLLKKVDAIRERGKTTLHEIHQLRMAVESKAYLLSMASFSSALEKMQGTATFTISDADARLVKSKFGARVSHMRGKVNYLCGILVMLGLIGTFWGLLGTITSVGQAMTKISESFAAQSAAGSGQANVDMGGFLQSISKPLEGMGVGFSASLFGLTGSLFLGFLNFLCSHAQNRFIEHFSRWMDDCIPTISQGLLDKVKDAKVPGTDELKSWLAGFVYLSNRTNQQIGELVAALATSNQAGAAALAETQKLYVDQHRMLQGMDMFNRRLKSVHATLHALGSDLKSTTLALRQLPDGIGQITGLISNGLQAQQKATNTQMNRLGELFERIEAHSSSLTAATEAQTLLLQEAQSGLQPALPATAPDIGELAASVTALLDEMNRKNDAALLGVFLRNHAAADGDSIDSLFSTPN